MGGFRFYIRLLRDMPSRGNGRLDLIGDDKGCITNVNRQLPANLKTIGQYKAEENGLFSSA